MAKLIKNATAIKITNLLNRGAAETPARISAPVDTGRGDETPVRYPPPFTVRYSVAAGGWVCYLPAGSLIYDGAAIDPTNAAVEGRAGWYLIAAELETGSVRANITAADAASQTAATFAIAQDADDAAALSFVVATVDADSFRVAQLIVGAVLISNAVGDGLSVEAIADGDDAGKLQLLDFAAAESMDASLAEKLEISGGSIVSASAIELVVRSNGKVQYLKIGTGSAKDNEDDDPCNDHSSGGDGAEVIQGSGGGGNADDGVDAEGPDDAAGGDAAGCDGQCNC